MTLSLSCEPLYSNPKPFAPFFGVINRVLLSKAKNKTNSGTLINGANKALEVFDKLPSLVCTHILEKGLSEKLNNAILKIVQEERALQVEQLPELVEALPVEQLPELVEALPVEQLPELVEALQVEQLPELVDSIELTPPQAEKILSELERIEVAHEVNEKHPGDRQEHQTTYNRIIARLLVLLVRVAGQYEAERVYKAKPPLMDPSHLPVFYIATIRRYLREKRLLN